MVRFSFPFDVALYRQDLPAQLVKWRHAVLAVETTSTVLDFPMAGTLLFCSSTSRPPQAREPSHIPNRAPCHSWQSRAPSQLNPARNLQNIVCICEDPATAIAMVLAPRNCEPNRIRDAVYMREIAV